MWLSRIGEHNPNDVLGEGYVDFFGGMSGEQLRFVPFNGACGPAQREWLRATLADCHARDEKVVLLSHLPLHHAAASWRNVAFDAPEVLNVIHESEAQVVCVLAGHKRKPRRNFSRYSQVTRSLSLSRSLVSR